MSVFCARLYAMQHRKQAICWSILTSYFRSFARCKFVIILKHFWSRNAYFCKSHNIHTSFIRLTSFFLRFFVNSQNRAWITSLQLAQVLASGRAAELFTYCHGVTKYSRQIYCYSMICDITVVRRWAKRSDRTCVYVYCLLTRHISRDPWPI